MSVKSLVLAYHGCDILTRDKLVSGELRALRSSVNEYDWLGDGAYFYEDDSNRALQYAQYSAENPQLHLTAKAIGTPAVVGAVLHVDRWLDMTTQEGLQHFKNAVLTLRSGVANDEATLPRNQSAFTGDADKLHRAFDRAVFETLHSMREDQLAEHLAAGDTEQILAFAPFQAVRGAFTQGAAVSAHSAIHGQSHIQIALRDSRCVKGWFLLPGESLCNDQERDDAVERQRIAQALKTKLKRRVRL